MKVKNTLGFEVSPGYQILLHYGDSDLLKEIQTVLQVGTIQQRDRESLRKRGIAASNNVVYSVTGLQNCLKIKDFFTKYPLHSKKKLDFERWCQCIEIIQKGRHKTIHGFLEIIEIRDQMNTAGKARMVTSGLYRNYEWFRSRLIGSTRTLQ